MARPRNQLREGQSTGHLHWPPGIVKVTNTKRSVAVVAPTVGDPTGSQSACVEAAGADGNECQAVSDAHRRSAEYLGRESEGSTNQSRTSGLSKVVCSPTVRRAPRRKRASVSPASADRFVTDLNHCDTGSRAVTAPTSCYCS